MQFHKYFDSPSIYLVRNVHIVLYRSPNRFFVAKECVRSAHNKLEAESNFRHEVEKTFGFVKEEKTQLVEKLKTSEQGC